MAVITYDGQSFSIDGRRIWLVGGTIDYARCPRAQWKSRIAAAKHAGLNTIVTSVLWSRHEPRPGQFDFTGDNDLRHFVELVGRAGMYCVLRVGPFVGGGFDFGGIPPWVLSLKEVALRTANTAFLEACSRFIGAVAKQTRDLQAIPAQAEGSAPAVIGGPIVLVQNESGWRCGHEDLARMYLGELNRYLHESGFEVPIINANDLWQGVEGEVDCWSGREHLLMNLRQLAVVRPMQPRLLIEYRVGEPVSWGGKASPMGVPVRGRASADQLCRDLCETLSAGAQYNIEPFFGGTNFGFSAGRLSGSVEGYAITSNDMGAPLSETGQPGELHGALRRVSMFASRFGRVLAHLDTRHPPVSILPSSIAMAGDGKHDQSRRSSVVHAPGSQGSIAFVFSSNAESATSRGSRSAALPAEPVSVLLPDGTVLPVYIGSSPVTWCLLDVRLVGRSQLDYCNVSAFALVGKVFVVSGPGGTPAKLSINGSPMEATVPMGPSPEVTEHENVTVVICNEDYLDRVHIGDDAVYLGAMGLTEDHEPIVYDAKDTCLRIGSDGHAEEIRYEAPGKVKKAATPLPPPPPPPVVVPVKAKGKLDKAKVVAKGKKQPPAPPPPPPPPAPIRIMPVVVRAPLSRMPIAPTLEHWTSVSQSDYLDGTSARYASIAGPADLASLGAPYGYGWYRIRLKNAAARRVTIAWPQSGDRLHLFMDGRGIGVLGYGPGAEPEITLSLKKGEQTLVALAENLGRFSGGQHIGERKGAFGHAMVVEPLKMGKPKIIRAEPLEVMAFAKPIQGVHEGDVTDSHQLEWELPARRKGALIIRMAGMRQRGLLLLNDTPIAYFDQAGPGTMVIEPERLSRGTPRIGLAFVGLAGEVTPDLAEPITFHQGLEPLTSKADWGFAKWEAPSPEAVRSGSKRSPSRGDVPTWHHATFAGKPTSATLVLDTTGLSKGQIYVNGRHLGRFFTSTAQSKPVGPQTQLVIPAPLIQHDQPNDLMVFDEHGFTHGRVRLIYR